MRRTLYILLFVSSFCSAQTKHFFRVTPTSDTTVHGVSWTSITSLLQNIARHDSVYTGTLTVPYGYFYPGWEIILMNKNHDVVATGAGITVTKTFQFLGTDSVNTYALHVVTQRIGTNSHGSVYPLVDWILPGAITCSTGRFSRAQADQVIDISSDSFSNLNGNWTDYAATGRKIYVWKSKTTSNPVWNCYYWLSTNPLKPVVFQFANVTIGTDNTGTQSFRMGPCQGVIIDAGVSEVTQYGLNIVKNGSHTSNTENMYLIDSDASHTSKWWMIFGVHVDNSSYLTGGTGIVMQVQNGTISNDNVHRFERFTMFNCFVENAKNEAFYLWHTTDSDTPPFAKGKWILIYNCSSNHSRNEGLQVGGMIHAQIFKNSFLDCGLGAEGGQMNAIVIRDGCQDLTIFHNRFTSTQDIMQMFPSKTGGDVEIFANEFETTGSTGLQNSLWSVTQSTLFSNVTYRQWNNLFVAKLNDQELYPFYNAVTPPSSTTYTFQGDGNVFISTVTTQVVSHNSFSTALVTVNNKATLTSNIATLKMVNPGAQDYRLAYLTSPLFTFTRNSTIDAAKVHWLKNYDRFGYKYVTGSIPAGPDAAVTLMTH